MLSDGGSIPPTSTNIDPSHRLGFFLQGPAMSTQHLDITVYPVSGWDTGPIMERDALALRIKYLDVETQEQSETQFFGIPHQEVQKLIDSLSQALAKLDARANGNGRGA